jgi:hypothetical protein
MPWATSSPVYGNLGWLYYQRHTAALEYTQQALSMSPDDLPALQQRPDAHGLERLTRLLTPTPARLTAPSARAATPCSMLYGRGVTDLAELAAARPDQHTLDPAVTR